MKKIKKFLPYILGILVIGGILYYIFKNNYVPSEYGPIEFEITMSPDPDAEEYGYDPTFMEGKVEIMFNPEDAGINRDDINSLMLKSLVLKTDYEGGFEAFEHITITINSDETETIDVGTIPIGENDKDSLYIKGSDAAEVPDFKNIKNFRLLATLNIKDGYTVDEEFKIKGNMMLNVMVVEKDEEGKKETKEKE